MNITIIGTGYVGLVTGACFAEMGNRVVCADSDAAKIASIDRGKLPIYEPGLDALVAANRSQGRLRFTSSISDAIEASELYFIAVGTPPNEDGSADLQHVIEIARTLGRSVTKDCTIVYKSTVPVGTGEKIRETVRRELDARGVGIAFEIISNPEFLKEGAAINDFMRPDRVVIGTDSDRGAELMRRLYFPFTRNHERTLMMGLRDAEMTKYAANAMLATRISLMNEVANLCERLGVDVENVRMGIGSDARIGYSFIYPGCGYGGSCLPKDVRALIHLARSEGYEPGILQAVEARNMEQKRRLFEKIVARFGRRLEDRVVAIWGLSFKPGTNDMREAPSRVLLEQLIAAGARVHAYDPVAIETARASLPVEWLEDGRLQFASNQYDALAGADALALVTEWKPFRYPDFAAMRKAMKRAVIFDGRNQYNPAEVRALGFEYFGIGR